MFGILRLVQSSSSVIVILKDKKVLYQIYMTIQIVTKDGRHLPLVNINPTQIMNNSPEVTEMNDKEIGQGLAKFLALETGKPYQWAGFETKGGMRIEVKK